MTLPTIWRVSDELWEINLPLLDELDPPRRQGQKRQAALSALAQLQREQQAITKAAVARQAGVSLIFLRSHPDLVQAIEEAAASPVPQAHLRKIR